MRNDATDKLVLCDNCGRPLEVIRLEDQIRIPPCRGCVLAARELGYDAGFDDGFDVGRAKAH